MSTRVGRKTHAAQQILPSARDQVEAVALVAQAKRDVLLRVHRHRLRHADLEDCLSQATLELVVRARRGAVFASNAHIANSLEQKFLSRIGDRRRALGGRSAIEAAMANALSLDEPHATWAEVADAGAPIEERVEGRLALVRLLEVAAELTPDQRLLLACQAGLGMECHEFCHRFGWSAEKFRKVGQRARARLARLNAEYARGERCARLRPDLDRHVAGTASGAEAERAERHLRNCAACRSVARALALAERSNGEPRVSRV